MGYINNLYYLTEGTIIAGGIRNIQEQEKSHTASFKSICNPVDSDDSLLPHVSLAIWHKNLLAAEADNYVNIENFTTAHIVLSAFAPTTTRSNPNYVNDKTFFRRKHHVNVVTRQIHVVVVVIIIVVVVVFGIVVIWRRRSSSRHRSNCPALWVGRLAYKAGTLLVAIIL